MGNSLAKEALLGVMMPSKSLQNSRNVKTILLSSCLNHQLSIKQQFFGLDQIQSICRREFI